MMQSVEAEALIKQAADYFRLGEADLTMKRGGIGKNERWSYCIDTTGLNSG